jgi:hypothetical protein
MKRKVSIAMLILASLAVIYGASAFTSVTLDRQTDAGVVMVDTDANAAVKFEALTGYTDVVKENDGKVSFDLSKLIDGATKAGGFNTEAQFTIGNSDNGVFMITNNSDTAVTVTMNGTNGLKLRSTATTAVSTTIAPGASASFYFEIDTRGVSAGSAISGTLQVRS